MAGFHKVIVRFQPNILILEAYHSYQRKTRPAKFARNALQCNDIKHSWLSAIRAQYLIALLVLY